MANDDSSGTEQERQHFARRDLELRCVGKSNGGNMLHAERCFRVRSDRGLCIRLPPYLSTDDRKCSCFIPFESAPLPSRYRPHHHISSECCLWKGHSPLCMCSGEVTFSSLSATYYDPQARHNIMITTQSNILHSKLVVYIIWVRLDLCVIFAVRLSGWGRKPMKA